MAFSSAGLSPYKGEMTSQGDEFLSTSIEAAEFQQTGNASSSDAVPNSQQATVLNAAGSYPVSVASSSIAASSISNPTLEVDTQVRFHVTRLVIF